MISIRNQMDASLCDGTVVTTILKDFGIDFTREIGKTIIRGNLMTESLARNLNCYKEIDIPARMNKKIIRPENYKAKIHGMNKKVL